MLRLAATRAHASRMIGRRNASTVSVQNIETRWKTLSAAEQNTIAKQLEEAQKGDWKVLSLDEKKAACELQVKKKREESVNIIYRLHCFRSSRSP